MTFLGAIQPGFRSKGIPHFGQSPGLSEVTPEHIGQKYLSVTGDLVFGTLGCELRMGVPWAKNVRRQCSLQK
jgi:hypothetical protein